MSCETNANKVSSALGSGGVTRTAAKTAYARATSMRRLAAAGLVVGVASAVAMHPSQTKRAGQEIAGAAKQVGQKYVNTAKTMAQTGQDAGQAVAGAAKQVGQKYVNTAKTMAQTGQDAGQAVAGAAKQVGQKYVNTAKTMAQTGQDAGQAVAGAAKQVGQKAVAGATDGTPGKVAASTIKAINTVERSNAPRGFATGFNIATLGSFSRVRGISNTLAKTTATVVNPLADKSRTSLAASVVQKKRVLLFFNKKTAVQVWNSSAGKLLNRPDHIMPAKNIIAEKSAMLKINGISWHRGTITFRTPGGQKRTMTHIQSLSFPAQHYYFNRPLSDKETAGLLTGQSGYRPEKMKGYLGQVSDIESLSPGWAHAKHQLLKLSAISGRDTTPKRNTPRVSTGEFKDTARAVKQSVRTAKQIFRRND